MMGVLSTLGEVSVTYLWIPLGIWTLMAVPIFLISRYLGLRHPAIHYHGAMALLLSLPVGFILMPLLAGNLSFISVPEFVSLKSPAPVEAPSFSYELPLENTGTLFDRSPEELVSIPPLETQPAVNEGIPWEAIVGIITFLTGMVSILSLMVLGWKTYKLRGLRRTLIPVTESSVLKRVSQLKAQFNIRRPVKLLLVPAHIGPMTFGGLKPVIGIPQHLLEEPDVLKSVLSHEFIHIQRFDYVTGWLTRCIRAVFVFHPGVVLLAQQIETYRELSCDSVFLERATLSPADYARLLFRFSHRSHAQCSVPMVQKTSTLKKRIKNMSTKFPSNPFSNKVIIVSVMMFLFLPALFVACSSGTSETEEDALLRLEAQVEYLREEIKNNNVELNAIVEHNQDLYLDDPNYNPNWKFVQNRGLHLQGLLTSKMVELENARLEAATAEWMEKLKD